MIDIDPIKEVLIAIVEGEGSDSIIHAAFVERVEIELDERGIGEGEVEVDHLIVNAINVIRNASSVHKLDGGKTAASCCLALQLLCGKCVGRNRLEGGGVFAKRIFA
ncbi:hypothetical protein [Adlercreutzia caecimuris]|uniref:hypothetical protein n=1 Tax=Adlercreutzia caecimuris TaxID=671266 RepID=UPI0018DC9079|nr:hypothetical protein [Adlercreutzia caecimuris]